MRTLCSVVGWKGVIFCWSRDEEMRYDRVHTPPAMIRSLLATLALAVTASAAQPPNIVFIFCDDLAYQAMSCYGDKRKLLETPNIDRLAKEGMRFDRCLVTNSICGPMRAVIQTGCPSPPITSWNAACSCWKVQAYWSSRAGCTTCRLATALWCRCCPSRRRSARACSALPPGLSGPCRPEGGRCACTRPDRRSGSTERYSRKQRHGRRALPRRSR